MPFKKQNRPSKLIGGRFWTMCALVGAIGGNQMKLPSSGISDIAVPELFFHQTQNRDVFAVRVYCGYAVQKANLGFVVDEIPEAILLDHRVSVVEVGDQNTTIVTNVELPILVPSSGINIVAVGIFSLPSVHGTRALGVEAYLGAIFVVVTADQKDTHEDGDKTQVKSGFLHIRHSRHIANLHFKAVI